MIPINFLAASRIQAAIECLPRTCADDHNDRYSAGKGEIEMSTDTGKWLIAGEDKTFIYALGPSGTNTFFCHVQSAGPERASKAEKEAIAALMADAPAMLDALELCAIVLSGERMSKSSLVEALEKARALIAKHRGGK